MLLSMASSQPAGRAPDPLALRALTHPLRWKLLDLVVSEETATATRCADVLGESVASCSYHLGILAKYGYIEPVPGRPGREKPWRVTGFRQDLSSGGLDEPGALAAQAATEVFLDHELARVKDRLRRQDLEPPEWQEASHLAGMTTFVTAAELQEIKDQLLEITRRYAGRLGDPASRPPGAREARIFTVTSVAPPARPPR
jgi:Helix-turn-helix domain